MATTGDRLVSSWLITQKVGAFIEAEVVGRLKRVATSNLDGEGSTVKGFGNPPGKSHDVLMRRARDFDFVQHESPTLTRKPASSIS